MENKCEIYDGIEIKTDCFAYKNKKCKILKELFCSKEKCAFYKTQNQYELDRLKAEERLLNT
jgi:hypothetical protein